DLVKGAAIALVGALVFTTHPTHAHAVAYLPARANLVLGVVCLCAIAAWVRFRLRGRRFWYGAALCAQGAAVAIAPSGILLFPVLVLVDLFVFTGASRSLRLDAAELWRQRWKLL